MPDEVGVAAPGRKSEKRADWNGRDWFVSFGDGLGRSWEDGRRYGFVSAGGGPWYSRTLRALPVGARVFVHIAKAGYLAVGETLREAKRFDEAEVLVDGAWVRLADQELHARYRHVDDVQDVNDDNAEYVVAVRWIASLDQRDAYWEKGHVREPEQRLQTSSAVHPRPLGHSLRPRRGRRVVNANDDRTHTSQVRCRMTILNCEPDLAARGDRRVSRLGWLRVRR